MLFGRLAAITLLFALAPQPRVEAQLPPQNWQSLYDSAVEAEDQADYKTAEALLEKACTQAQSEPDAAPQRIACIRLAELQAVGGALRKADQTAQLLVERLEDRDAPSDLVSALLESADILSARTRTDLTVIRLKRAADLLPKLSSLDRIDALQRMSLYYFAVGRDNDALVLADRAQAELIPLLDFHAPAPLRALTAYARLLTVFDRHRDALRILEPAVAAIDRKTPEFEQLDVHLQEAYLGVVAQTVETLELAQVPDAAAEPYVRRRTELAQRLKPLEGDVYRSSDDRIELPRLKSKVAPKYPGGARASRAAGTVYLLLEIWPDGKPHRIRPAHRAPYGLTSAAITSLRKWRFFPATKDGVPVKVVSRIQFNFHMR